MDLFSYKSDFPCVSQSLYTPGGSINWAEPKGLEYPGAILSFWRKHWCRTGLDVQIPATACVDLHVDLNGAEQNKTVVLIIGYFLWVPR